MQQCLALLGQHCNAAEVAGAGTVHKQAEENQFPKSVSFIIQKYLESPMLVQERKFDIRVWVLLSQDRRLFIFREGYIRTSSSTFTLEQSQISKPEIHLTNNAVQQRLEDYGKFESGNMLSYTEF